MIRQLHPADAEEYRAIRLATLRTEPAFFGALHDDEAACPLGHFADALAASCVFGAYDGSAIVGVVRLHRAAGAKERHKAGLHGFFVQPSHRRRGLGGALLRTAIAAAMPPVEQLTLAVVADNRAAIALYERAGFDAYGVEPRARKDAGGYSDLVLMALRLVPDP